MRKRSVRERVSESCTVPLCSLPSLSLPSNERERGGKRRERLFRLFLTDLMGEIRLIEEWEERRSEEKEQKGREGGKGVVNAGR